MNQSLLPYQLELVETVEALLCAPTAAISRPDSPAVPRRTMGLHEALLIGTEIATRLSSHISTKPVCGRAFRDHRPARAMTAIARANPSPLSPEQEQSTR